MIWQMNKKIHSGNFNIKTPQNYSISTFLKDYIAKLKWYTLKVTTDKNPYVANDLVTKYRKQQFLDTQKEKKKKIEGWQKKINTFLEILNTISRKPLG